MAEKRDWNVGLNSKGLEKDVSEEQARRICTTQGSHSLFIIDAHHGPFVTNEDGSIKMNLLIDGAELIPAEHEDRVRTFMRALYLSRPDQYGQQAFEEAQLGDRDADSAGADLDAIVERDASGQPTGIWAGDAEDAAECPAKDCTLAEGHDGDHQAENQPEGKVVAFSSSGGK